MGVDILIYLTPQQQADLTLGEAVRAWFEQRPGIPGPVGICRNNAEFASERGCPNSASLWNAIADALAAE